MTHSEVKVLKRAFDNGYEVVFAPKSNYPLRVLGFRDDCAELAGGTWHLLSGSNIDDFAILTRLQG